MRGPGPRRTFVGRSVLRTTSVRGPCNRRTTPVRRVTSIIAPGRRTISVIAPVCQISAVIRSGYQRTFV